MKKVLYLTIILSVFIQSCALQQKNTVDAPELGIVKIDIYYCNNRKSEAIELANHLLENGYLANVKPPSKSFEPPCEKPSYIYFKKEEYKSATVILKVAKKIIGHPINSYYSKSHKPFNEARIVLTDNII